MARAFTNNPDLAGQIIPGAQDKWEYRPGNEDGTDWNPTMFKGTAGELDNALGDISDMAPDMAKDIMSKGGYAEDKINEVTGPPDLIPVSEETGWVEPASKIKPDIPMDRGAFEKTLYEEIGGNPYKKNIVKTISSRFRQELPMLWDHVFQGKKRYGGRLNAEEAKFWNNAKQDHYNMIDNEEKTMLDEQKEMVAYGLAQFDKNMKERATQPPEEKQAMELNTFREKEKIKKENKKSDKKIMEDKKEIIRFTKEMEAKYKKPSDSQKRLVSKDLASMEEKILSNPDNEAVQGAIRFFNENSKTPYMFVWTPKHKKEGDIFKTSATAEKIELPIRNGKQLTSDDIRFTAEKYNKTIEDVLRELGVY